MTLACHIPDCSGAHYGKGLCSKHYQRQWKTGSTDARVQPPLISKYRSVNHDGKVTKEHLVLAEKALGKKIPKGIEVHHVDCNGMNNAAANLVICQDHSYHMLLHKRQRAMDACGNPNFLKCEICKTWSSPDGMYVRKDGKGQWHRTCGNITRLKRKQRNRK